MSLCGALPLGSAKVKENSKAQILQNFNVILCNLWISSAMAMAMSIYRSLCVPVFSLIISLLEMLIAFGNAQIQEPLPRATFQLLVRFFPQSFSPRDAHFFW